MLLSGVGEPILGQNIRFHCPIYYVFKFNRKSSSTFTRHIWLYDRGDYDSFAREITNTDWNNLKDDDIDTYANNITNCIIGKATKHIPNKSIKIRQSDPPWLTNTIRKHMRKRKRYFDKYKRTNNSADFERYKQIRNLVTSEVRKSRQLQTDKLANDLKTTSTGQKNSQNSSIPPLQLNDQVFSDDQDKADILNTFFTAQTILDDSCASLPSVTPWGDFSLSSISL